MKARRQSNRVLVGLGATLLIVSGQIRAEIDPVSLWSSLVQPTFDTNKVTRVENVELRRDVATLTLADGQFAFSQPVAATRDGEGRVFAAAFKGTGFLHFAPTLPMEKQQLALHSGQEVLKAEFTEAVFVFTDNTLAEFSKQARLRTGDPSRLQKLYESSSKRWTRYGFNDEPRLLKSLLSIRPERHTYFMAELKTRRHGWLFLVFDRADPEEVALVHFDSGRRAVSIWSKFPAGGRRPQEVFADLLLHYEYRISGYKLDVTVKKNTELLGEAELKLEMQQDGERVLLLGLDPNLRVSAVVDEAGQSMAFFQPRDPKDDIFFGNYLVVVSPEAFEQKPITLRIRYAGKRVVRKVGSGNFFCESFGWYPSYGSGLSSFADRSDFDITLRVPKKYTPVAVGTKMEDREENDYRITRWKSDLPLAVAGFAFGDYKTETATVGDTQVEIYANKQPDDVLRGIEIAAGGGARPGASAAPVAIGALSPSRMAKEMATEIANSLRVMESFFGPYPYKKLAVCNIPYSYGQGWPSLLYLSALSFLDSTQRNALGIRDHSRITFAFRAHETSHKWWGHRVSWKSYHDQWLSEGFAEFSGILYTLYRKDPDEYFRLVRKDREDLLAKDREGVVYEQLGPIYAGYRLSSSKHPGGYSTVVYNKGGWVLHMIRMLLYDPRNEKDFDARFKTMMQDFTNTFHNQPASTEDFKKIVEKHIIPNMDVDGNGKMDWFFDSWVYGSGIPHYEFSYAVNPAAQQGQFVLQGVLRQSRVPENFRMIVPIFVRVDDRMTRLGWIPLVQAEKSFEVLLQFRPDKVTINEWEDVLSTVEYK